MENCGFSEQKRVWILAFGNYVGRGKAKSCGCLACNYLRHTPDLYEALGRTTANQRGRQLQSKEIRRMSTVQGGKRSAQFKYVDSIERGGGFPIPSIWTFVNRVETSFVFLQEAVLAPCDPET